MFMFFDAQTLLTGVATILFVIFLFFQFKTSRKNLPPGPKGLPLVGYLPFLGKIPHLKFRELKQRYGDVFYLRLGHDEFVVLCSYKLIKEALSKYDGLMGRPIDFDRMPNLAESPGVLMNYGPSWTQIRRFSLTTLRGFGIGKSSLEPKIQDEIGFLLQLLRDTGGKPNYVDQILRLSTTNTVCAILFGERLDYEDKLFKKLMNIAAEYTNEMRIDHPKNLIPFFILKMLGLKDAGYYGTKLFDTFLEMIEEQAKKHQTGKDDSFIDVWFDEANKSTADQRNFNKRQLSKVVWDLFVAASDTTSTTLHWCLLYMTKYPDVQLKVQQEIDEYIGRDRTPNMIDQKQMHYTEAVILEISRIVTILPLSLPRRALQDTEFLDYVIPKDAIIVPNIWMVHHDPEIYPEPEEFKPERFLNAENEIIRRDELVPFGVGKRQCMGESLARMNLFLYFASFLQNFTFKPMENTVIDLQPKNGGILHPKLQQIRAIPRR